MRRKWTRLYVLQRNTDGSIGGIVDSVFVGLLHDCVTQNGDVVSCSLIWQFSLF